MKLNSWLAAGSQSALISLALTFSAASFGVEAPAKAAEMPAKAAQAPAKAEKAAKPDLAKGGVIANGVCVACHASDGNSTTPTYPKLAGQHPEYLVKQLNNFKVQPGDTVATRNNAVMAAFAAGLSADDMRNVATYYAKQAQKPGTAKASPESVSLGQKIYRGGLAEKGLPACAGCHGPTGAGMPAQYPRIGGQWAEYTTTQLTNFREGVRKNNLQMSQIAAKMSDKEMKAVSDYIAGLH